MNSNTALNNAYANGYCQYRLPCGYCEKLGRDCPKQSTAYNGIQVQVQKLRATEMGGTALNQVFDTRSTIVHDTVSG